MTRGRPAVGIWTLVGLAVLFTTSPAGSESVGAFPNVDPWPITLALGGIPRGLGEGVEAVMENPTGMLTSTGRALGFAHASLFTGGLVRHQTAAFLLPRFEEKNEWRDGVVFQGRGPVHSAFGLGVTHLSAELPGDETYGETQISLAYAHQFPGNTRSGLRLRFLQAGSTVDGSGGTGIALDVGIEGTYGGWRIGAVARSIYSQVNWDRSIDGPVPAGFDAALERMIGGGVGAMVGGTLQSSGTSARVAGALRWRIPSTPLTLLAGPAWRSDAVESRTELGAGMSLRVSRVTAAYGMRTGPEALGETHRVGIEIALP